MTSAPILRIVDAVSVTGCDAATVIPAAGGQPRKIRCPKFTAEIVDAVADGANFEELIPTGQIVDVWHKFTSPMEAGATLTLALRPDGRWTVIVWECT